MNRMEFRGDNVLCTFGMDQNQASLVARAIRTVLLTETDWAQSEFRRLTAMYGNPEQETVYVSNDTTFDMICDDLIGHGWFLFDAVVNDMPVAVCPDHLLNRFVAVTFGSPFQPEAKASVTLLGSEVAEYVTDMENSCCWFLLNIKEA